MEFWIPAASQGPGETSCSYPLVYYYVATKLHHTQHQLVLTMSRYVLWHGAKTDTFTQRHTLKQVPRNTIALCCQLAATSTTL
ncbi:hypothetical protein Pelo_19910 [Pelomyxa schiedti]|nr:hypothetical protein Pelo_19910 [Pelomyxa schiedti]